MSFESGDRLGPYEILAKIGEGGMGAVYRARDPRIAREVAIKVLPAAFVGDAERRDRFEREAKVLASLNHPNVAQLYAVEEGPAGTLALILELVEGTNLDERLAAGALPVEEAIAIAGEIAAAVADAHDKGVVHRDLKPQNIRLTPSGSVKVLDFGLAKALDPASAGKVSSGVANSPTLMNSPTLTGAATELGVILGTAAYMSPEQARGRPIDRRADVWAFGCILFEMLSGERLFAGETTTDTLAAVLRREIPWERLPAGLPYPLRLLLKRCLERDPKQRLRDLGDAALLLAEPGERATAAPSRLAAVSKALAVIVVLSAIALGLAAGWAIFGRRNASAASSGHLRQLAIRLPSALALNADSNTGQTQLLAISPDGSRVAFVARDKRAQALYLRDLRHPEVRAVKGGDGATSPFFSPDGRWLAFFARGKLQKVAIDGGDPIALADAGLDRGGVWSSDGNIYFAPDPFGGLKKVAAVGGPVTDISTVDETAGERSHRWPALLPGEKEVAFTVGTTLKPGDYEDAPIDVVEISTGKRRRLLQGASMVRFTSTGHILLGREGEIQAIPLAAANGGVPADAAKVALEVNGDPASGVVYFDVASDGTLIYAERDPKAQERTLAWIDPEGRISPLPVPPLEYRLPRLSPDGKRIAVGIGRGRGGSSDIWVVDVASGTMQRLTFDGKSAGPVWSPDGKKVIFTTGTPRAGLFAEKLVDGSADARIVAELDINRARGPLAIAPDGTLLFSEDYGAGFGNDLLILVPGDPKPRPVAQTAAVEIGGVLSPDGRYMGYSVNRSGAAEYFVQTFPGASGRWQIAQGSNGTLRWAPDGHAIYVETSAGMAEVPVSLGPPFTSGKPKTLFSLQFAPAEDIFTNFDVARDGRFLVVRRNSEEPVADRIVVALDWFDELRRLSPIDRR